MKDARDAAIRERVERGMTLQEIAAEIGYGYGHLAHVVKQLGLKAARPKQSVEKIEANKARAAEFAALRPRLTFEEIGDRYGITRERVRQVLKAHGYTNLLGTHSRPWKWVRVTRICLHCKTEFQVTPKSRRKFCSRVCGRRYHEKSDLAEKVIELRRSGKTWRECGEATFGGVSQPATYAQQAAARWAKRRGLDYKQLVSCEAAQ